MLPATEARMTVIHWERVGDDGDLAVVEVPAKFVVCPECQGEGRTLARVFRGELDGDLQDDPNFMREYRKGGAGIYGCSCGKCDGRRVITVPDTRTVLGRKYAAWEREDARERRAERRMALLECGDVEAYMSGDDW